MELIYFDFIYFLSGWESALLLSDILLSILSWFKSKNCSSFFTTFEDQVKGP